MATERELKRGEELFKCFLQYNGRETALLPYLKKYSEEDNQEYTFETLLKYLSIYKESALANPNEVERYKKLRSISKTTIKARGKEICDTLMENRFKASSLDSLAKKYASEDKRYLPYCANTINKMRQYYLSEASPDYLEKYQTIFELSKRTTSDGLDFNTLKTIVSFESAKESLAYMKDNNISYDAFKRLRNAYFRIYPNDSLTRMAIDNIEDLILYENKLAIVEINKKRGQKQCAIKMNRMKNILEKYINSGKDNLEECIQEAGITINTFYKNLNEEKDNDDEEFKALYQKYLEVEASFDEERRVLAETLLDYYRNGVSFGEKNRRFNLYDFYCLTDKSAPEITRILRTYLSLGMASRISVFINNLTITSKFKDRNSFIDHIKYKYPKIDEKERDTIIGYIESKNWPYSITLFKDIYDRLIDGLVTFPEHQEKNSDNLYK